MTLSAGERNFPVAIGRILDIGKHSIAEVGFESPDGNREINRTLGEEGGTPSGFSGVVKGRAGVKNILVHEYTSVDYTALHHYVRNGLDDFSSLAKYGSGYRERDRTMP